MGYSYHSMYVLGCSGGAEGLDRCGVCVAQYLRVIILLHNIIVLLWGILPIFIIFVVVVGIKCICQSYTAEAFRSGWRPGLGAMRVGCRVFPRSHSVQTAGLDKDIHGHNSVNRIFTLNPLFVKEGVGALPGPEFELLVFWA